MKKLQKFIITWNEVLTIPLGLFLFWYSPVILRAIDSTSATYDYGIFQVILFTIIQLLIYHGLSWLMVKITWPGIYKFLDDQIEHLIEEHATITDSAWRKMKVALVVYLSYFAAFIILSRVI
jgi:hypothetical protein